MSGRRAIASAMRALLLAVALAAGPAAAQVRADTTDLPPNTEPFEVALVRSVYGVDAPAVAAVLHAVNDSAYPAYFGAVPVHGLATLAVGGDLDAPLRLAVAEAGAVGLTVALKNLIRRPRPYAAIDGIVARDRRHQGDDVFDPYSFPSGHTSTAFVLATSLSLSYPEWYVIAPAAAWAATMGVARVWLGVHYPSDVLVGAGVGVGAAVAVHVLMPDVFDGEDVGAAAPTPTPAPTSTSDG